MRCLEFAVTMIFDSVNVLRTEPDSKLACQGSGAYRQMRRFSLAASALTALIFMIFTAAPLHAMTWASQDAGAEQDAAQFQRPPQAPATPEELRAGRHALAHVDVIDTASRYRASEHLSFGVPLSVGLVQDAGTLRLWNATTAVALPCQTRVLSRWPDGSVRWVLVDSRMELQARETVRLSLGIAPELPAPESPWRIQRGEDGSLLVDDGQTVWPLLLPQAKKTGGKSVLGLSARLVDIFGHDYEGVVDASSLTWLERGPLRAVARLQGAHRSLDGEGLPIDFHTFTAHVHLYAGQSRARVEWTLENTPLFEPPGRLAFDSYGLQLDPGTAPSGISLKLRAEAEDSSFLLEQDGLGTRVLLEGRTVQGRAPEDLWAGLLSDGPQEGTAVFARMVDSAQNHPSRLSHELGGPLQLEVLPSGMAQTFFLDDGTRKTFAVDIIRASHAAEGRALVSQVIRPAHVALVPLEVLATGAWGDAGHFYIPSPIDLRKRLAAPQDPPTGWADWGESKALNTHQSGSPRNQLSVFLEAMQAGRPDLNAWNLARAQHAMDMRPYHLSGFLASRSPWANLYEGLPHSNNKPSHSLGRSGVRNRHPEYKQELPRGGHGYNGFDPEHMTLDDVYEAYLLTGSWLALDALRSAGEAVLTWKEIVDGSIHSSRTFGWTLRALVQVHRATGEERYLDAARQYVALADAERGRGDVKYLRRMKPDPRHLADEHYDSPFMVAVALHGLSAYWAETRDPIVPPMAADLVAFCMSALRSEGFLPDMPTDTPLPPSTGEVSSPLGVTTWVPGAIAAAAFITGDHRPVDRLLPYYGLLQKHSSDPVQFGSKDWHWWQPFLASVQQRHGDSAIANPFSVKR